MSSSLAVAYFVVIFLTHLLNISFLVPTCRLLLCLIAVLVFRQVPSHDTVIANSAVYAVIREKLSYSCSRKFLEISVYEEEELNSNCQEV